MKFNDFLNEVYSDATILCNSMGIDTRRAGSVLDEAELETIVGRLCAKGKLNLTRIISNFESAKNEEVRDTLIDLANLSSKVMDYVENENDDTLDELLSVCDGVSAKRK